MRPHNASKTTKPSPTTTLFTILLALAMVTFPIAPAVAVTLTDSLGLTWEQTAKITPEDSHETVWRGYPSHSAVLFGAAIAVDGDTLVASTGVATGSMIDWVYVFERNEQGGWVQVAKFEGVNFDPDEPGSAYGFSVDVDESAGAIVVGDPSHDQPGEGEQKGLVYLYERGPDGEWTEATMIESPVVSNEGEQFGRTVTINGNTLVVSAPLEDTEAGPNAGAAYVYERDTQGEWIHKQRVTPEDPMRTAVFGGFMERIVLEDDLLVLPAHTEDRDGWQRFGPENTGIGAVYVFEKNGGSWEQVQRLSAPDGDRGGCFGSSVSYSADRLLVADFCKETLVDSLAPWNYGMVNTDGRVSVFERQGDGWELQTHLRGSDSLPGDFFAWSSDIAGDRIVVTAKMHPTSTTATGAAYIFEYVDGDWVETAKITAEDTMPGDRFGRMATFLDENTLFVGVPNDDNRGDEWPYPFDNTRIIGVQSTDGWTAGSVFEFSLSATNLDTEYALHQADTFGNP